MTMHFDRRRALIAMGGLVATALASPAAMGRTLRARVSAASGCTLTPEVTGGPYYIVNRFTRRNITDGQAGLPLRLELTVRDATSCAPIPKANVEIWHANAHGTYSGYGSTGAPGPGGGGGGQAAPTNALRFLRGHQVADAHGKVIFDTIYPGWYPGRTPHIHVKVHVGGATVHTGQLFFPDSISDSVYRSGAYRAHGQPDTTDASDMIFHQEGGTSAILALKKRAGGGYIGSLAMNVKR
jgi:protocatechuate 3,4-dioxygenase beta subunit